MARKPCLPDDELYEVATYLARPEVETELHAEMHPNSADNFRAEYDQLTGGMALPAPNTGGFYVWGLDVNKYGMQLRFYFKNVAPVPPVMERLYTDQGKWFAKKQSYRVNHSNLVLQLLECGFLVGMNNHNFARIQDFMARRFPQIP